MSEHIFICVMFWGFVLNFIIEVAGKGNTVAIVIDLLLGAWSLVLTGWLS